MLGLRAICKTFLIQKHNQMLTQIQFLLDILAVRVLSEARDVTWVRRKAHQNHYATSYH